jgi:hypothetical protein
MDGRVLPDPYVQQQVPNHIVPSPLNSKEQQIYEILLNLASQEDRGVSLEAYRPVHRGRHSKTQKT